MPSKKMIYNLLIISVFILGVAWMFWYSHGRVERECRKQAEQTFMLTARTDQAVAAEEDFYYCLIKKGVDPYKYKYSEKGISDSIKEYIKAMTQVVNDKEPTPPVAGSMGSIGVGEDAQFEQQIKNLKPEELVVVFKNDISRDEAETILKTFPYGFRPGSDLSKSKAYFNNVGPSFIVTLPAGKVNDIKIMFQYREKQEIQDVYKADWSITVD